VSAIIKDSAGNLVNYAKVSDGSDGKAIVSLDGLADGTYTIQLFAEDVNGDKMTDYASAMSDNYSVTIGSGTSANSYQGKLASTYKDQGYTVQLGNGFVLGLENEDYGSTAVTVASTGAVIDANGSKIGYLAVDGNTSVEGSLQVTHVEHNNGLVTVNGSLVSDNMNAFGSYNKLGAAGTTAMGANNNVSGANSGAFGNNNTIAADTQGGAFGNNNVVSGYNSFAFGNNAQAQSKNSVALGSGSIADRDNTISVGSSGHERQITNVAPATQGTDATNLDQLKALGAMSAALAGLHYMEPTGEEDDHFAGSVAYGGFAGEKAAAVGIAYKPNPNLMFSASTSIGTNVVDNANAYNAGVSLKFGKGNTLTQQSMRKEVSALKKTNEELHVHLMDVESNAVAQQQKINEQEEQLKAQSELIKELTKRLEKLEKKK